MTHQHTYYWATVCVQAYDVPLLKCQIHYQWGIQTLSGTAITTCKGAKKQSEGAVTSSFRAWKNKSSVSFSFNFEKEFWNFVPLTQKYPQTSQALLPNNIHNPVCVCVYTTKPASQTPSVYCCCCSDVLNSLSKSTGSVLSTDRCVSLREWGSTGHMWIKDWGG